MKTIKNLSIVMMLSALLIGGTTYAQNDVKPGKNAKAPITYNVGERVSQFNTPTTFTPMQATAKNGAISENIITSTERILNKEKPFLKKGVVKPVGETDYSAWQMTSDEGGEPQSAPNPLTYFAAGSASDLLTQVERGIQIMDLDVNSVKVETEFFFRWNDMMTDNWSGYTDKVVSNIIIESNESPERIKELKDFAVQAWATGEALANETTIDAATVINGDHWDGQNAKPGKIYTPVSVDNGLTFTNTTADLNLMTIEIKEIDESTEMDMRNPPNPMTFSEIGIAESANNEKRPYLHRVRAKSLTPKYETWDLYVDDSRGYQGIDAAPTSRDYFTLGTSFCLMSQLTPNQMYFQMKGVKIDDFRVEHQFNYVQDDFMTPSSTGRLDDVITRIIVKSDADEKMVNQYTSQALRCCFAGEGIQNATEMETNVYLNGKMVK